MELGGVDAAWFDEAMHCLIVCESLKAIKDAEYEAECDRLWRKDK